MDISTKATNMKNFLGCRRAVLSIDLFVCCLEMKSSENKQGRVDVYICHDHKEFLVADS